jgi:hypothetical protein
MSAPPALGDRSMPTISPIRVSTCVPPSLILFDNDFHANSVHPDGMTRGEPMWSE